MKLRKVNTYDCTNMEKTRILIWLNAELPEQIEKEAVFEIRELPLGEMQIWYYLRHPNGDWMYYNREEHRRASNHVEIAPEARFPWPGKASYYRDATVLGGA